MRSTEFGFGYEMDTRIATVVMLMNDNLRKPMPPVRMADSVNLSTSHLHYLFKIETGMSPARYLRTIRMELAKELLETTFLSVKEIMVQVGLNDASHFVRNFKKQYGLNPTAYRKSNLTFLTAKAQLPSSSSQSDI
jgi:transcriptional regulator GlxA family with amidase domain